MFRGKVAFDFETTGLNPWRGARPFLLGMEDEFGKVVLARPFTRQWRQCLKVLADPKIEKIGYNAKFDIKMARSIGAQVNGKVHDAMLLVFMNNEYEPNLKLKDVAYRQLNMPPDEESRVKKELARLKKTLKREPNYSDLPKNMIETYLEGDLDRTMKLFWKHEHIIDGPQRRVYEIERNVIPNVVKIEEWGVNLDRPYCEKMLKAFKPRLAKAAESIYDHVGVKFNINSPKQLGEIIESQGMDTGQRNKDGSMNTNINLLQKFESNPLVQLIMEYRSLAKIGTTYFEAFLEHQIGGIIHPSFWPFGEDHGIKTARFSSSDPNFQNIPGGGRGKNTEMLKDPGLVRRAIKPRPGYAFLFGDFDQIEFVIFACGAGDESLLADIRKGIDLHTANAYRIFGKNCMDGKTPHEIKRIRHYAKELNFSFIFGMGIDTYAMRAGITSTQARQNKAKYFNEVPAARDYMLRTQADLLRDGYVQDTFGRRYHVPRDLCYKAANALCQGPAAVVMKRGINRTFERLNGMDAHPFLPVHDELGIEVKLEDVYECAHALREGMEDRENFAVPIKISMAVATESWADKRPWNQEEEEKWKPKRKISVLLCRGNSRRPSTLSRRTFTESQYRRAGGRKSASTANK